MAAPNHDPILAQPKWRDPLKKNPRHMWFFTFEDIHDPAIIQGYYVLPSPGTIQYLGLLECLIYSGYRTQYPDRLDYYMLSKSMKKAKRLKSDKSVLKTWKRFCRNDTVVHIIIRPKGDPSPSQLHAASHYESLAARRHILGVYYYPTRPELPGIDLQPGIWGIYEKVAQLVVDDGTFLNIKREVMLELIKHGLYDRKPLIDFQLSVFNDERQIKRFTLTAQSWKLLANSLWKEDFACLWKSYKAGLKMKTRKESGPCQFFIGIGLMSPGKAHECKECEKSEKEAMLLDATTSDGSNATTPSR